MDFVRKAVRAIGRCALKIESSAERCVAVLVDLIQVPPPPPPLPNLVAHVLVPHALACGATAAGLCAALGFFGHMATLRALGSHVHTLVHDMATLRRPKCRMWCKRPLWSSRMSFASTPTSMSPSSAPCARTSSRQIRCRPRRSLPPSLPRVSPSVLACPLAWSSSLQVPWRCAR